MKLSVQVSAVFLTFSALQLTSSFLALNMSLFYKGSNSNYAEASKTKSVEKKTESRTCWLVIGRLQMS